MTKIAPERNKALVLEAFDTLFNKRDYAAAERFWADRYIQHSAHIAPGREGLFNLIGTVPATLRYEYQLIVAEGDYVIAHGGATGNSVHPFDPSAAPKSANIGLAVVYTIFAFAGFEGATTLGEEARKPTKTIPRALIFTVLSIGIFYVVVTYAEVIGFGVSKSGLTQLQTNQTPFTDLATHYSSGVLSVLITLATISSFVALNIATIVTGSAPISWCK